MPNPLQTRVTELLGCEAPIIQTGMGWVAEPELVAGACNAGAFGFLAAATIPPQDVEAAILEIKKLTERPFGVNFLMDAPGADVISEAIIRQGVRAAGYNRAPNADLIGKLKAGGVVCVPTCGAVKHAVKAEQLGADIIIVQGGEGGGHTGSTPTSLLASASADAVKSVPIVAAGGFRDGRGLIAALALGAEGIAMGTRFLMTAESPLPDASFERYQRAQMSDVVVSTALDGMPQRMITNELLHKLENAGAIRKLVMAFQNALALRRETGASIPDLLRSGLAMRRNQKLTNAQMVMAANAPILARIGVADGDPVNGYLASGTVAGVIDDRPTCEALVARIVEEAEQTLKKLCP